LSEAPGPPGAGSGGALAGALAEASGVLFLCTGNMVRSAFAELYARHLRCPLPVASAATTYRNEALLGETARALEARSVSRDWLRDFRPRHLADVLGNLDPRGVVLGMTRGHLAALRLRPEIHARGFLLGETLRPGLEIRDPVLEGADFEATFALLARCVEALVEGLRGARPLAP